jgi:hypothetical protein
LEVLCHEKLEVLYHEELGSSYHEELEGTLLCWCGDETLSETSLNFNETIRSSLLK